MRPLALAILFAGCLLCQEFKLGGKVHDFALTDLEGKVHSFDQLKGNVSVLVFFATRCPVSNAYNERMDQLYRDYNPKGVNLLFVNANATESTAEIAQHARRMAFPFPVYRDLGNAAADLFGASATPEVFVMDAAGVIRYHGAIDDAQNEARVKSRSLRDALDALLRGADVPKPETKAFGCTIKRVRKSS